MTMEWKPIRTAPKDGTQVLLASLGDDDEAEYGIRQGFYEPAFASRAWYDIDGEEIEPEFWMPLPPRPVRTGDNK